MPGDRRRIQRLTVYGNGATPLTPSQAADLLEVIEDRAQLRSTIVTSQLPVKLWHDSLGDATVADAILDRLVHNAHRLELRGDSLRRPPEPAPLSLASAAAASNAPDQHKNAPRARNRAATTAQDARE